MLHAATCPETEPATNRALRFRESAVRDAPLTRTRAVWHVVLVVLASLALLPGRVSAEGIEWLDLTYEETLALAAETNQPIVMDVYTTWCPPCRQLDAEVFSDPRVAEALSDMIFVRFDAEDPSSSGPEVRDRYHVVGFPTVLVLAPNGEEYDRVFGFLEAEAFVETVRGYTRGEGTIESLRAALDASPDDLELVLELGKRAGIRGEYAEANELLDTVIILDPGNAAGLRTAAHFFRAKYMWLRGNADYVAAIDELGVIIESFPDSPEAAQAPVYMAMALLRSGRVDEGVALLAETGYAMGGSGEVWASLASVLVREGVGLDAAFGWAMYAASQMPDSGYPWEVMSEIFEQRSALPLAYAAAGWAARLTPDEPYFRWLQSHYLRQIPLF